jgi:hypothetical protein
VSVTHAGAADVMTDANNAAKIFTWDHQRVLSEADAFLAAQNIAGMRRAYARLSQAESYDALAKHYLAVTGPDDPRYDDLLRGFIATANPDFQVLYSALSTRCELEYGLAEYTDTLPAYASTSINRIYASASFGRWSYRCAEWLSNHCRETSAPRQW